MKKATGIIAAILIILMVSIMGIVVVSLFGTDVGSTLNYMHSRQAFFIAEGGIEYALELLQGLKGSWANLPDSPAALQNVGLGRGRFTVTLSNQTQSQVDLTSTANINALGGENIVRVITVQAVRLPVAFGYVLYAGGNINTRDASNISITGNQQSKATDFPTVDFSYYQSIAEPGQDISGNYTFNSAGSPYSGIWYIDGNVEINSDVTINGTVVSTKRIRARNTSNITINPSSNYPALIANNAVDFKNTDRVTINGLIFAGADGSGAFIARKTRDFSLNGTIIARGKINFRSSADVTASYDSALVNNPPPGFSLGNEQIVGATNWDEVY